MNFIELICSLLFTFICHVEKKLLFFSFTFIESLSNGLEISPNQIVPLHNKQVPIAINKNCHCVLAYIIG